MYHVLAPSLGLKPTYGELLKDRPYPVSAKPDRPLTVANVTAALRSYYEGTEFDQTKGLASGPFGTPDHAAGGSKDGKVRGNWERTIGLWRTSDSYVVQSRAWLPDAVGGVLWWGAHSAPYTVYTPFAAGMRSLPPCTLGSPGSLDKATLFWAVRYLYNLAQLKRNRWIVGINQMQREAHAASLELLERLDAKRPNATELTAAYHANAQSVLDRIWRTADELMFKFADGYITEVQPSGQLVVSGDDYPDWWLKAVGYEDGPPPVPRA